jgi:hypothetical protein
MDWEKKYGWVKWIPAQIQKIVDGTDERQKPMMIGVRPLRIRTNKKGKNTKPGYVITVYDRRTMPPMLSFTSMKYKTHDKVMKRYKALMDHFDLWCTCGHCSLDLSSFLAGETDPIASFLEG